MGLHIFDAGVPVAYRDITGVLSILASPNLMMLRCICIMPWGIPMCSSPPLANRVAYREAVTVSQDFVMVAERRCSPSYARWQHEPRERISERS